MKNFLKVVAFSLIMIAFFAGFSNFGVPRIEPEPPPKAEKLDLKSMTLNQFIALGDRIYNGRGTCTLCHNEMGRAPLLNKIGAVAAKHMVDPRYKGKAKNVEDYLYESMVEPSAFVVAGFGKAGTQDTESPMPDVSGGSIRLSEAEIKAVIAYMQDTSGVEVTVTVPTDVAAESGEDKKETTRPPLNTPEAALAQFTCTACHKVAGAGGVLGPDLSHIGAKRDKAYLRRAILDPNAEIVEGFAPTMPPNYGEQMYAKELEMLVDYLAGLK